MKTLIHAHALSKSFNRGHKRVPVLHHLTLNVHDGEFLVIVGPSGSGKSTLLRILSTLDTDYSGTLVYDQQINRRDVSFVFQHFALLPWLTVYQNIEIGLLARGWSSNENHHRIMRELKKFELTPFARAYPKDLSGGMQQRVGLARALVSDPKVIFMDEPFSELDSFTAEELRKALLVTWQERHVTIVMVTHIVPDAIELADRIAVFTPRPATIEHIVANPLPRPRDKRSPDFFALEDRLVSLVRP